jgi:hypothetical protein
MISNGYSPANLANSSTRQKFAIFGWCEYSPKRPFSEICETRHTRRHLPSPVARTPQTRQDLPSRVARTHQTRRHSPKPCCADSLDSQKASLASVTRLSESGEFGKSRLDHFMHIKYVICAKTTYLNMHACANICQEA